MNAQSKSHWGNWIKRRAAHVGYRRGADFATAVGCSRGWITRWFACELPPPHMRKGFDRALAVALKTEVGTLFRDYATIAPEDAPMVVSPAVVMPPTDEYRRKIGALVELLPADKLRDFYRAGEAILRGETAAA